MLDVEMVSIPRFTGIESNISLLVISIYRNCPYNAIIKATSHPVSLLAGENRVEERRAWVRGCCQNDDIFFIEKQ